MSRPEYTWCVESANATPNNDANNPTNDIDIPTRLPRARTPTFQIYLGSVELPIAQYLIESLWNRIYFDQGTMLIVNSEAEQCIREFTVNVNGSSYTAIVPPLFNPVVDVDVSDPTAPIFTTLFEHALDIRGQWDWGAPIELISSALPSSLAIVKLTTTNTGLEIINNHQFQLIGAPVATYTALGGLYGYVHAPPIATPTKLASIVTAALNAILPGYFLVTYSTTTGQFCIQSKITQSGTCVTNPPLSQESLYIVITSLTCLPGIMGFGVGNIPIPTVVTNVENCATPVGNCPTPGLCGGYGYQCFSTVQITPGNYTADGLASQLNLQFNRLTFDGGCSNDPASRPVLVFLGADGVCYEIDIEYGTYSPDTFAEFLQSQMNILDPSNVYTVTYDHTTGQLCFSGTLVFGLEFSSATQTLNPATIGFDPISYRGQSQYCSSTPFFVPTATCCSATSAVRYAPYGLLTRNNANQARFSFFPTPPRAIAAGQATLVGAGDIIQLTSTPTLLAHGLQPEDTINVMDSGTGAVFKLRVIEVLDAFTVNVDRGTAFPGAVFPLTVSYGMADPAIFSFLWSNLNAQRINQLYPRILGFAASTDVLYSAQSVINAPYEHDLDPAKTVLLQITVPSGTTHCNHTWGNNNLPSVWKVILYPQFRLERNYPCILYVPDMVQITKMHFVWLNAENHTPYQFHGKQWSMTLNLVVAEAQLEQVCF